MKKYYILCFTFLFISPVSKGFQFEFLGLKDPVHQIMTARSLECAESKPEREAYCESFSDESINVIQVEGVEGIESITTEELQKAVIWADDPIRELSLKRLHRIFYWTFRIVPDQCEGLEFGLENGIRCSSHYGPFQFMHSMENVKGESAVVTKEAILDWITYAYAVAKNEHENGVYFNDREHCEFEDIESEYGSKFMETLFKPAPAFPCDPSIALTESTPWTLSTIFSFYCGGLFSTTCDEKIETPMDRKRYRLAALGAILHVVQDSYAKGHTLRGEESQENINIYECLPIKQFQLYGDQDHDLHGTADSMPSASEVSCSENSESKVDGPITASAEVLRLFMTGATAEEVTNYLSTHVFVLDEDPMGANSTDFFRAIE